MRMVDGPVPWSTTLKFMKAPLLDGRGSVSTLYGSAGACDGALLSLLAAEAAVPCMSVCYTSTFSTYWILLHILSIALVAT